MLFSFFSVFCFSVCLHWQDCLSCLTLNFCPSCLSSAFKLCLKTQQWFEENMIHHYEYAINVLAGNYMLFSPFFSPQWQIFSHFSSCSVFFPLLALHICHSCIQLHTPRNRNACQIFSPSRRQSTPVRLLLLTCFFWAGWKYLTCAIFISLHIFLQIWLKRLCFPVF